MTGVNMAATIIAKSSQLNADDLLGGPRTITITRVSEGDSKEQPIAISYEGDDGKPFMPCKSMRRVMVAIWGLDAKNYIGKAMTLYRDPTVLFGGMQVGGTRISHMSDMTGSSTIALMASKKGKKAFEVKPLQVAKVAPPAPPPAAPPAPPAPPIDPKTTVPDMNGPTLSFVNSKGDVYKLGPDKWASQFETWFSTLPFDKVTSIYNANLMYFDDARNAGYGPQADAAIGAYDTRKATSEGIQP